MTARGAVRAIRVEAAAAGRDPRDVKVFSIGIAVTEGRAKAEAKDMRYTSAGAGLAHSSALIGIDFARYDLHETIAYAPGNAIQSATAAAAKRGLTQRDLLAEMGLGSRYAVLTGDAVGIADELRSWVEEGEVAGTTSAEASCRRALLSSSTT